MVGELKEAKTAANDGENAAQGRLGLAVRPLDADEARAVGVKSGVVVEAVNGPAARAGIQQGDVILSINGTQVKGVEDLRVATAKAGKSVAVLIQRDNTKIFVPLNLG